MRATFNSITKQNMSVRVENDFLFINDKKYLNMKQAGKFTGKSFKTISAWTIDGAKTGQLQSLMIFGSKYISEDDLISYKAHLRRYLKKSASQTQAGT